MRRWITLAELPAYPAYPGTMKALHFDDEGVIWRAHRLECNALLNAHQRCALAFGSCSFREPMDGLAELKWQ